MITTHIVVGARPNFMKAAPLVHAFRKTSWARPVIVHTGQHFSASMSDNFFEDLKLDAPDHNLGARGETHARQTAAVMVAYEELLLKERPNWVVVVGDVNSTLAATLAAKKLDLPVAHLEAGLRNFDRTLPEEINRIVTDSISDLLWTPSPDADANLLREGVTAERIVRVGNIMIDNYMMLSEAIASTRMPERLGLNRAQFVTATIHRAANVDDRRALAAIVEALAALAEMRDIAFPVHPRTRNRLAGFGLLERLETPRIRLLEPLGYIDFMSLVSSSALVVTDSGGVQEETSFLGIPCLTLRPNTERPITISEGTNRLINAGQLLDAARAALAVTDRKRPRIELWDGNAAARAVKSLAQRIGVV